MQDLVYSLAPVGSAKAINLHDLFSDWINLMDKTNKMTVRPSKTIIIIIIIIIIITLFQEDNIFGTDASLTYGPQIQRHRCV